MKRLIISIDEEKCNGCGNCITGCAEGALALIDGKARLVKEQFCDGMGDCIGTCPTGALILEERVSDAYDEVATRQHVGKTRGEEGLRQFDVAAQIHRDKAAGNAPSGGCPGSALRSFSPASSTATSSTATSSAAAASVAPIASAGACCPGSAMRSMSPRSDAEIDAASEVSQLTHWPVQLMLVPPNAPYLQNADVLVCADCAPFALAGLHSRYLVGKVVLVGCPKLDDIAYYQQKLQSIFAAADLKRVTVLRMEVPCCSGLGTAVMQARAAAGSTFPVEIHTVGIQGDIVKKTSVA